MPETRENSQQRCSTPSARRRVMDLLARRAHSETELRAKLADRYPDELIDDAIAHAREQKWLTDETELARTLAEDLHRRGKGLLFINAKLAEKGLPPIADDHERELEKARKLAQTKWAKETPPDEEARAKIARVLQTRGFDSEIVRKVIHEKF